MPKFICNYTFEWGLTFTVFKRNGKWLNFKVYVLNLADSQNDFILQLYLLMCFHFHFFQGKRRRNLGGRKWAGGTRRGQNRQQRGGRFKSVCENHFEVSKKDINWHLFGQNFKVDENDLLCEKVPAEDSVLAECRMLSANKKSLTEVCKHFLIQSHRRFVPFECQSIWGFATFSRMINKRSQQWFDQFCLFAALSFLKM